MRRIAIADIHGCAKSFQVLIQEKLKLKKSDKLYLLGDYINKGPDSKGVLDFILQLIDSGFHIEMIRGNHDQLLLDLDNEEIRQRWDNDEELQITLHSFKVNKPEDISGNYSQLLKSLPFYFELEDYWLVHAGFNFKVLDPLKDYESMMNIRQFENNHQYTKGKTIIHGHTPIPLQDIKKMIDQKMGIINIDAGCSKNDDPNYGNLIALDLDTLEIVTQPNIEQ